jgi:hypothetical protein
MKHLLALAISLGLLLAGTQVSSAAVSVGSSSGFEKQSTAAKTTKAKKVKKAKKSSAKKVAKK